VANVSYGTAPAIKRGRGRPRKVPSATTTTYTSFQTAYDWFNRELFNRELPGVLITLQRKSGAAGYFSPHRFTGRGTGESTHELALNPDAFPHQTDEEILSTLTHEMAHVWQQCHGTPPRRCYHDREWSQRMKQIGLHPSSTGKPGGKETGQHMSDYIVEGGPFQLACQQLQATGFRLHWESPADDPAARVKAASKTKYSCTTCEANAWAKPGAALICGDCFEGDGQEPELMKAANAEEEPS